MMKNSFSEESERTRSTSASSHYSLPSATEQLLYSSKPVGKILAGELAPLILAQILRQVTQLVMVARVSSLVSVSALSELLCVSAFVDVFAVLGEQVVICCKQMILNLIEKRQFLAANAYHNYVFLIFFVEQIVPIILAILGKRVLGGFTDNKDVILYGQIELGCSIVGRAMGNVLFQKQYEEMRFSDSLFIAAGIFLLWGALFYIGSFYISGDAIFKYLAITEVAATLIMVITLSVVNKKKSMLNWRLKTLVPFRPSVLKHAAIGGLKYLVVNTQDAVMTIIIFGMAGRWRDATPIFARNQQIQFWSLRIVFKLASAFGDAETEIFRVLFPSYARSGNHAKILNFLVGQGATLMVLLLLYGFILYQIGPWIARTVFNAKESDSDTLYAELDLVKWGAIGVVSQVKRRVQALVETARTVIFVMDVVILWVFVIAAAVVEGMSPKRQRYTELYICFILLDAMQGVVLYVGFLRKLGSQAEEERRAKKEDAGKPEMREKLTPDEKNDQLPNHSAAFYVLSK